MGITPAFFDPPLKASRDEVSEKINFFGSVLDGDIGGDVFVARSTVAFLLLRITLPLLFWRRRR